MASEDRIRELEDKYEGFKVYDNNGDKIGKVDDLFIDENDREEYIGVKMGFLGMKSTLIPMDIVRANESDKTIEVAESKDHVKDAPSFNDDEDITPEYEERIHSHFGLQAREGDSDRGSYGGYSGSAGGATDDSGLSDTDDDDRDRDQDSTSEEGSEHRRGDHGEGVSTQSGAALGDTGITNDRFDEDTQESHEHEHGRNYGEGVSDQSGTHLGDTGVSNDRYDKETEYSGSSDRGEGHGEGVSDQSGSHLGETGITDHRFDEDSDSSDQASSSESSETPINRETTETETFQEGGRTKVRRRTRREEVEFVDDDQNS